MARPDDDLTRLKAALAELDAPSLRRRVRDWRKGGLPARSFGDSSRSSETVLPEFDKVDRWLRAKEFYFATSVRLAANHLEAALRAQNAVLLEAPPVPDLVPVPCGNLAHSDGILEPGRLSGECSACRKHFSRYGVRWPNKPAEDVA